MFRSWKLGSMFGIGIYVHWTFLLLLAAVFFGNSGGGHVVSASHAVAMLLAVFGCVVLHELGHALTARHYGIPTRDITLYPIGGVARLERLSERPLEEFWIALAGPAVNVAIAILLAGLWFLSGGASAADAVESATGGGFITGLLAANVVLVLFNMLPAFPMDGGRVLRALLTPLLGRLRATNVAAGLGVVMAGLFFLVGLWTSEPMVMLVAVFVYFAGQQELAAVRQRERLRQEEPLEVLPVGDEEPAGRHPWENPWFSGVIWDGRAQRWVQWRNGRPVHSIGGE
jgi:Zn-dependent protease